MQETEKDPPSKSKFEDFVQQAASEMMHEPEHLQEKVGQLRGLYRPLNVQEEFWLTQIAIRQLNAERIGRLESGLFSHFIEQAKDEGYDKLNSFPQEMQPDTELNQRQRHSYALAAGFRRLASQPAVLLVFYRAQSQAERHLRHAQEQFDRIRKQHLTPPAPVSPPPADATQKNGPPAKVVRLRPVRPEIPPQPQPLPRSNISIGPEVDLSRTASVASLICLTVVALAIGAVMPGRTASHSSATFSEVELYRAATSSIDSFKYFLTPGPQP